MRFGSIKTTVAQTHRLSVDGPVYIRIGRNTLHRGLVKKITPSGFVTVDLTDGQTMVFNPSGTKHGNVTRGYIITRGEYEDAVTSDLKLAFRRSVAIDITKLEACPLDQSFLTMLDTLRQKVSDYLATQEKDEDEAGAP